MKRAATTKDARAMGKEAALSGQPTICPFESGELRKAWQDGFRKHSMGTRVDLSVKAETVTPEPVVEAPAPAPPVTPEKPAKVAAKKAPLGLGNPFKEGTVAAAITAKLLLGGSYDLQALFAGVESKCPAAILGDLKRKALPVQRNEQGQYFLAVKGGK